MKEPIRVVARIIAKPRKQDEVKSVLSGIVKPTQQESGCLHYELLQNHRDSAEFVLIEEWESQTALDNHSSASHTKTAEAKMESLIEKTPPDVRFYRTIA